MEKFIIIFMIPWLVVTICLSYITYLIGYTRGFNLNQQTDSERRFMKYEV